MTFLAVLAWLAMALAGVGCLYALAAAWVVRRLFGRPRTPGQAPPVTLLKPLYGEEPGLAENLESFLAQNYSAPVQMLIGVQDQADPAVPVVQALIAAHPGLDIELV